mgnify:CR=1 FL=1
MLAIVRSPILLWAGFVVAHLWLGMLALYAPGQPIGDVTTVYKFWIVDYAFEGLKQRTNYADSFNVPLGNKIATACF